LYNTANSDSYTASLSKDNCYCTIHRKERQSVLFNFLYPIGQYKSKIKNDRFSSSARQDHKPTTMTPSQLKHSQLEMGTGLGHGDRSGTITPGLIKINFIIIEIHLQLCYYSS